MQMPEDIAPLLDALRTGDAEAADRLYALLYDEFRLKAHHVLRAGPRQTLCTTELVNETWLRLHGRQIPIESREHFANLAARAMRQVLVDRVRHRQAQKRGAGESSLTVHAEDAGGEDPFDVLALHDTMTALAQVDDNLARIAELHLFGGFSVAEVAEMLGLPERTAFRRWRTARMFLIRSISGPDATIPES